jgi:hypothetical protein
MAVMEFLQANWVWLLLLAGTLWLLFRGGLGCGMGRRNSTDCARHGRHLESRDLDSRARGPLEGGRGEAEHAGHRGHRGC